MSELRRVYRKKNSLLLAVLCAVNFVLFLFSATAEKEITLAGEELADYVALYPAFLENTAESGRVLASLDMYRSGYSYEVLVRSAAAYEKLSGITLKEGDNRGIVLLLQYQVSDLFLLSFLLLVCADFLTEKKKGLSRMVRSCVRGRGRLYVSRVVILFCSAFLGAALLYGGDFLGMLLAFGKSDLTRALQSLPEFMKCPYPVSVGEYFLFSVLLKAAGCFTAALLFFLLISFLETTVVYMAAGVFAAAEVLLHLLIAPVSSLNSLRYLNLYAVLSCGEFFEDYCFLNCFGRAVPALSGVLLSMGCLALFLTAAGYVLYGIKHGADRSLGGRAAEGLALLAERVARQRSLAGWEGYKLFIRQGGLLVLGAVLALHLFLSARYPYSCPTNARELLKYEKYEGPITREGLEKAERERMLYDEIIERYEGKIRELMAEDPVNSERIGDLFRALTEVRYERAALIPVLEDMRDGLAYTEKTNRPIMLIKPYTYELLFLKDERTRERAGLLILIGIIGAVSGVFAYDAQSHVKDSIRTAYRGRAQTVAAKLCVVLLACTLLSVLLHLVQVYQIGRDLSYNNMDAPIQSLRFMRQFGPYVSIRGYLVLLFAVRSAAACCVGLLCALISRASSDTIAAVSLSAAVFAVWALLSGVLPGGEAVSVLHLLGISCLG